MKTKSKSFFKITGVILLLCAFTFTTNVEAGNRNRHFGAQKIHKRHVNKSQTRCAPGDKIPLDGGLSILLIGAAAFGIKKLRGNKNEEI